MHPTFLFLRLEVILVLWAVVALAMLAWSAYREGFTRDLLLMAAVFAAVGSGLYWMVPKMGIRDASGHVGLAVRGYGFFVAIGVASGLFVAARNATRAGIPRDYAFSAAFAMLAGGFIGARLFYVIEYFDDFRAETWGQTIAAVLRYYEGGLVVYGGLIGGTVGFFLYTWLRKIDSLNLLDVMAPAMAIGLAFGRIGCLMNGCCWGGVCEGAMAIRFPPGSPPYVRHLETGELLGFHLETHPRGGWVVTRVDPNSLAARGGLKKGDRIVQLQIASLKTLQQIGRHPSSGSQEVVVRVVTQEGLELTWTADQLPHRSLPVHPAQVYASLNAFLLTALLYLALPWRQRPGDVAALMLTLYPISRILLEWIRSDEPGIAGTSLTISQWVSLGLLAVALAWWGLTRLWPRRLQDAAI
ncbi:MAG TPA: hypothetical protein ENJ50_10100 [Planctomycetaceae bacterium]|nr:hypothetical protein [Planctomycetaceae bacterium]